MRCVLLGGTGVIGRSAVRALIDADHDVVVLARSQAAADHAESLGATTYLGDVLDPGTLLVAMADADAVVNLVSSVPFGRTAWVPGAWRRDDRLREIGTANVVEAARLVGARRLVQASSSALYADGGDGWVTEASAVEVAAVTEPTAVAESLVQGYTCGSRTGVVLRLGRVVGDDPQTRHLLQAAAARRPVGTGDPQGWTHLVHTDDVGTAVLAALHAPSGVYNVGAAPVRRQDLVDAFAAVVGVEPVPLRRAGRLLGAHLEPYTRSLRVCSDHFAAQTGWRATRPRFESSWLGDAARQLSHVPV